MNISQKDFEKLKELEESLWKAETRCNQQYMDQILSPDFFEFGRSGRIYQRAQTLAIPFEEIHTKLPLKNFQIHFIETNIALVTYLSEVTYDEIEMANRSSLWVKTPQGWQIRFHQGTAIK